MRVLLDTNVVLDVLLNRAPWGEDAAIIWRLCLEGTLIGHVSATSCTDIYYIARRLTDRERARTSVRLCLDTFTVCSIDHAALELAYSFSGNDFEDNLQAACALLNSIDFIITRDVAGFAQAPVQALTAKDLLLYLAPDAE